MDSWVCECQNGFYSEMCEQIIDNAICLRECADGLIYLSGDGGVPPGLFAATGAFNHVYEKVLAK